MAADTAVETIRAPADMEPDVKPVAIVTGAGSGIGQAAARMFHDRNYAIVAADVSAEALSWAADVPDCQAVVADASNEDATAATVQAAADGFGRLDVAVLNAGIARRVDWTADDAVEQYDRIMAVNARGVVIGIRYAAPVIATHGGGSIVVVGSTSGIRADPDRWAYNASKAAATNVARAAALDWAHRGVRVNVLAPGPTFTPILQGGKPTTDHLDELSRSIPLHRLARPEEQAEAIYFLASPAASYITGAVLMCDGGVTANVGLFPPHAAGG
jgi:meso-butanediol dehydrogenase / (S,S)-butanediol dehydrogenase / diacetyl reductase